ncbi:HMGS [Symbiodinium pilosum]|uniref:HMGS protein n=1 Tax=Symbiodinium pilosum TaxID=2952 RepID=A0A812QHK2_SYMPI|nr:HMGS [Symbiodinium pilosum]
MTPEASIPLHNIYIETWMRFDYNPQGRRNHKISVWKYEEDVYYLMQIDKFGRRFYHRGFPTARM